MSPLNSPKEMMLFDSKASDNIENVISRIVNHIYHCKALCKPRVQSKKQREELYYLDHQSVQWE
jgi:hypothetical protein